LAGSLTHEIAGDDRPGADRREGDANRYLLKALETPDVNLVFETGKIVAFRNREYLLRQNDVGDGIHIILSGVVESIYVAPHGRELMLATWHKGDFVGAPYVLGDHRHSWSARALGRVEALHLDQAAIRRLISLSPAFAIALIECLGFKGETYSTLAQTLAGQKVDERLALVLVKLCENAVQGEGGSIQLGRVTQANLARMIGATRQSVSLVLSRLQDDGTISMEPTTTVVHDLAALRRLAG